MGIWAQRLGRPPRAICRVAYLPITRTRDAPLLRAARGTIKEVELALFSGLTKRDEKTGGGYIVAGNACMQSGKGVCKRVDTVVDGVRSRPVVPYTRRDTFLPGVQSCIASAARR